MTTPPPDAPTGPFGLRLVRWWAVLAAGIVNLLAGVVAIAVPGATLLLLGLLFGVALLVSGVLSISSGVSGEGTPGAQVLAVLLGFVAVLGGFLCLVRPGAGLFSVLIVVACWFLMIGVGDLIRAAHGPDQRAIHALLGTLGVLAGIVLVVDPVIGLSTLALLAGLGFLVRGAVEVALALALRRAGG